MLDVETRAAELGDLRHQFDRVAEPRRCEKTRFGERIIISRTRMQILFFNHFIAFKRIARLQSMLFPQKGMLPVFEKQFVALFVAQLRMVIT